MDNNEVVTEEVAAVVENSTGIEIESLFEEQVDYDTFSKSDFRVVKVKNCEAAAERNSYRFLNIRLAAPEAGTNFTIFLFLAR